MSVGKIVANVIANTGPFQAGLKEAGKDAKKFGAVIGKGVGALAKLAAGAALTGAALTTALSTTLTSALVVDHKSVGDVAVIAIEDQVVDAVRGAPLGAGQPVQHLMA